MLVSVHIITKKTSENFQEKPQSQITNQPIDPPKDMFLVKWLVYGPELWDLPSSKTGFLASWSTWWEEYPVDWLVNFFCPLEGIQSFKRTFTFNTNGWIFSVAFEFLFWFWPSTWSWILIALSSNESSGNLRCDEHGSFLITWPWLYECCWIRCNYQMSVSV